MIRGYQKYLSPLKRYTHCIYTPTCSQYAIEALEKYGVFKGTWLACKSVLDLDFLINVPVLKGQIGRASCRERV